VTFKGTQKQKQGQGGGGKIYLEGKDEFAEMERGESRSGKKKKEGETTLRMNSLMITGRKKAVGGPGSHLKRDLQQRRHSSLEKNCRGGGYLKVRRTIAILSRESFDVRRVVLIKKSRIKEGKDPFVSGEKRIFSRQFKSL